MDPDRRHGGDAVRCQPRRRRASRRRRGPTEEATLTFSLKVTDEAGLYHEDAVLGESEGPARRPWRRLRRLRAL